jgi:hypothetical protein
MGACGCIGTEIPIYRLPGPGSLTYVVNVYPSCEYCDTPAGVTIDLYTEWDLVQHGLQDVPYFSMMESDGKPKELGPAIPVVDRDMLYQAIDGWLDDGDLDGLEFVDEHLRKVVYETVKRNK